MTRVAAFLPALALLAATTASAGTAWSIRSVGPDENRLVLVIVGDGYLASQQIAFLDDAEEALAGFLAESPYQEYSRWINAYALFEASNEAGADKPAPCYGAPVERDTFFDATFCTSNIRRLLTVDGGKLFAAVNAEVPTWDVTAVVVNDTEYGGAGGGFLTFSTDPGAMIELFLHEAGHTFGELADEYGGDSGSYPGTEPREPNVTLELDRALAKWAPWIDAGTPIPTPGAMDWTVGLYEGGRYYDADIWRPVNNCKMRSLGRRFCAVCKEAHIQELHAIVSPLDGAMPDSPDFEVPPCGTATARLDLVTIVPDTLEVEWSIDGMVLPGETGRSLNLDAGQVPPGGGRLSASVFDATAMVRRRYLSPMTADVDWNLVALPGNDLDGDGLDDDCDPDIDGDGLLNDEDCAPRDPFGNDPAREIGDLQVGPGALGAAALTWEDVIALDARPGGNYVVLTGRIAELREDRGFDRACSLVSDATPMLDDERPLPPSGRAAWWYLVAVVDDCGSGSLGSSSPPAPDARAGLDAEATPSCP